MLFLNSSRNNIFWKKYSQRLFAAAKVKGTRNLTFREGETSGTHFGLCKISNFAFLRLLQLQKVFANIFSENIISQTI